MEVKYGAIGTDGSSFHGYHIIKFSPSPYTLKEYLSIDGKFISSSEMVCEGNHLFPININFRHYVLQKSN